MAKSSRRGRTGGARGTLTALTNNGGPDDQIRLAARTGQGSRGQRFPDD
jgi:hypothetical protein